MNNTSLKMTLRQKQILAGLFLSKFDRDGLDFLGFGDFIEAFNVVGLALEVKPASVKNYRDEFDPIYPNNRKGWHNRPMRAYCKDVYDEFDRLDIESFAKLVKQVIYENNDLDMLMDSVTQQEGKDSSFAKRLITGKAAEHYFKQNYTTIDIFKKHELEDTTQYGCGFDFKLYMPNADFLGVEVKGLNNPSGNISLTEKEHSVAKFLGGRYFLFVVKNFKDEPFHIYFDNPLQSKLQFSKSETTIKQISWSASV